MVIKWEGKPDCWGKRYRTCKWTGECELCHECFALFDKQYLELSKEEIKKVINDVATRNALTDAETAIILKWILGEYEQEEERTV